MGIGYVNTSQETQAIIEIYNSNFIIIIINYYYIIIS